MKYFTIEKLLELENDECTDTQEMLVEEAKKYKLGDGIFTESYEPCDRLRHGNDSPVFTSFTDFGFCWRPHRLL